MPGSKSSLRLTWAALWLGLFIFPAVHAQESATGLFVCEVREIPSDKFPVAADPGEAQDSRIQAASGTDSRLVNLKIVASGNGIRSVANGPKGNLEIESIFKPDFSVMGGNFTFVKDGQSLTVSSEGEPGKIYCLGSVRSKDADKTEVALVQTASEASAAPSQFPNTEKKVSILIEFWDLPLETAAALVKPKAGSIATGDILSELRTLSQSGSAVSTRLSLVTVDSGRFSETTEGNINLKIEPLIAKDGRGLSVNYALTMGENEIIASVNTKNGDSLLLGTMESAKPGSVKLVFLHTSSTP